MRWNLWKAFTCMPTCHGFETICSLDRAIERADDGSITRSRKEHSKFQDEILREIAHRHYHASRLPHRLWVLPVVWVHRAFGSHSKVWSWSLDSSATRIGRASDCRRGRVKKKKKKGRVKRSMLLNWLGHVRQLPSFPLCETFPQIP